MFGKIARKVPGRQRWCTAYIQRHTFTAVNNCLIICIVFQERYEIHIWSIHNDVIYRRTKLLGPNGYITYWIVQLNSPSGWKPRVTLLTTGNPCGNDLGAFVSNYRAPFHAHGAEMVYTAGTIGSYFCRLSTMQRTENIYSGRSVSVILGRHLHISNYF